jgi:hypothetical protein
MGGMGSGRRGWHASIAATDSYVLSAGALRSIRPGAVITGTIAKGKLTWRDGFELDLTVEMINGDVRLLLEHEHRSSREPDGTVRYYVDLVHTRPYFGGRRWWFLCPRSGRRVAKLYLPLGGFRFWSRRAYALAYQCQRESPLDRVMRKARKLHRRLGGDGGDYADPPPRPKRMRQPTYDRLWGQWAAAAEYADTVFGAEAMRRFGHVL